MHPIRTSVIVIDKEHPATGQAGQTWSLKKEDGTYDVLLDNGQQINIAEAGIRAL